VASAITHAVVGASIGAVAGAHDPAAKRPGWLLPLACAAAAVAPDLDVIMHRWVAYAHPFGHRGAFHAPAFYLALALALTALVRRLRPTAWPALLLFVAFFLALGSHSALDMLTDGGLGVAVAWPMSDARWFFPWRPIPVSPLSVAAFFGPRGLRVLAVELWIAAPVAAAALLARIALRRPRPSEPR
jgi:inner membrane protein